uniref:Uncharacterized protein n=1 Tax=Oryza rufipogon TaxID=4529 RepID=A0A0E0RJU5_ORYRU
MSIAGNLHTVSLLSSSAAELGCGGGGCADPATLPWSADSRATALDALVDSVGSPLSAAAVSAVAVMLDSGEILPGGGFQGGGGVLPLLPLRVPPTAAPVSPGDAFDGAAAASTMKQRQFGFDGRQQYAATEQHGHREQGVDSYGVAAPHHFPSPSPRHAVQFSQANPSTLRGSVDERFPVFVLLAVSAVPEADGGRRRVRLPAGAISIKVLIH